MFLFKNLPIKLLFYKKIKNKNTKKINFLKN